VIAPESPDIPSGAMPNIEQRVADASKVHVDCETVPLPVVTSRAADFTFVWERQLTPMLFGVPKPLHNPRFKRSFSVQVIVSQEHAAADEVAETVRSLWPDLASTDEIVIVGRHDSLHDWPAWLHDAGRIRCIEQMPGESFIAARNRAAWQSSRDLLVFTDANVEAPARWVDRLAGGFYSEDVAAVGPAIVDLYRRDCSSFGMTFSDAELNTRWLPKNGDTPYSVPLLPGVFLGISRWAFEEMGGFDPGMRQTGGDDLELCLRLWTSGYECVVTPKLEVAWMNPFDAGAVRVEDYWQDLLHNLLRLAVVHFSPERLGAFMDAMTRYPEFAAARAGLLNNNPTERKNQIRETRVFSDTWFFQHHVQ